MADKKFKRFEKRFIPNKMGGMDTVMVPRDLTLEEARKFVRMYVNQDTLDMGEEGYKAIVMLFTLGKEKGIISSIPEIDLIFPH